MLYCRQAYIQEFAKRRRHQVTTGWRMISRKMMESLLERESHGHSTKRDKTLRITSGMKIWVGMRKWVAKARNSQKPSTIKVNVYELYKLQVSFSKIVNYVWILHIVSIQKVTTYYCLFVMLRNIFTFHLQVK